jgi:hypothetical protein
MIFVTVYVNIDEKRFNYCLNLTSQIDFCKVMCSFLEILKNKIQGDFFEFFIDKVAFLVFEYQNYVSSLVTLYNYIHSIVYKKGRSLHRDFILNSYVTLTKRMLDLKMYEVNNTLVRKVEFAKIFEYREKIASVRNNIKKGMLKKIDFYLNLVEDEIDLKSTLQLGEEVNDIIEIVQKEIDGLTDTCIKNLRLLKEVLAFEVCLLEKNQLSVRTRQALKDTQDELPFARETIKSKDQAKGKFNFYNSSNVVVFANCLQNSIRITKFTSNACDLFGVSKEQLLGAETKTFMPASIAAVHDVIIMNYLNGNNQSRPVGSIQSVARTHGKFSLMIDGNFRSVIIIPKLEYKFSDDIYIGAVIIVRKKNQHAMIYTEHSGSIIGVNRHASDLLGEQAINQHSLFSMIPRLFSLYFPLLDKENLESIRLLRQHESSNRSTEAFECLFFRMLSTVPAYIDRLDKFRYLPHHENDSKISEAKKLWDRVKQYLRYSRQYASIIQELTASVYDNLTLITNKLDSLLRVTMRVEYHRYQLDLELYEICISSIHSCSTGVKRFFKFSIEEQREDLVKLMQLSPEVIKSICRCFGLCRLYL